MPPNANEPFPFARLMQEDDSRPSHPKSLVEMAYEQLLSMIVTMKIAPGAHIGIEALARHLRISQTPIREALTLLEAQKLAYKIPNVGFRAANLLTPFDIDALFEARLMIEPAMAALAAERASDETLQALVSLADDMAKASEGGDVAYAQFAEGDAKLHHLIARGSGNRFLSEAIEGLHVHLHIFRFLANTNATRKALQEHAVLIEGLLARDAVASEAAMRAHLHASRQRMDSVVSSRDAAASPAPQRLAMDTTRPRRGGPRNRQKEPQAPFDS